MANNDILEQQRKARENFLELKKMQQGEMEPEPKPSEVAVEPKTFSEKMQNFWFHYKWHTIGIIVTAIVVAVLCVQCATREKYDLGVVYFAYEPCMDAQLTGIEEYLESYGTDIDGDGKVNINVVNCSFSEKSDVQYKNSILTKVQSQIIANHDTLIYIMDDKAYEFLNNVADGGVFQGEKLVLGKEFYEKTKSAEFGSLPEGLGVYIRRVEGTTLEKNKDVKVIYNECEKIIDKIKNKP